MEFRAKAPAGVDVDVNLLYPAHESSRQSALSMVFRARRSSIFLYCINSDGSRGSRFQSILCLL